MSATNESDAGFDFPARVAELRCHTAVWLRAHLDEVVAQQRALKVEELATRRALDVLGHSEPTEDVLQSRHHDSPRTMRQNLELARRLESLPAIAAAAHAGELSPDQLAPLVQFATPASDDEWARRGPNCSPSSLERMARSQRGVTAAEAAARREAREFKWWWRRDGGMLAVRGEIPDVHGALVANVFERMVERMKPLKGEPWDTRAHRGADALVDLCKNYSDATPGPLRAHITFQVPPAGPAEVEGVTLADETVAELLPDATLTSVTVGEGQLYGARTDTDDIPAETKRFVRARDQHCRVGTCDVTDCDFHHLKPRSEGGGHDPQNVVLAGRPCGHHRMLIPNGPWILEGDPSCPDGLRLVHVDQLARAP